MEALSSAWVPAAALACLALVARTVQGSWLAPCAFAPAIWSLFIALPLLALSDRVTASSTWAIVAIVFFLQFGSFLTEDPAGWKKARASAKGGAGGVFVERALRSGLLFTSVALVGGVIFAIQGLRRFGLSFSFEGFMSMGSLYYPVLVGGEAEPWWFRLARMWVFPAILLAGIVSALDVPRWKKALGALALLPTLIEGMIVASRFTVTMAVCFWVASYLAAKTYCSSGRYRMGRKTMLTAASIGLSCAILYVSLGIVRGHQYDDSEDVSVAVRANLLGYLVVFDRWFQASMDPRLTWGAYSLAGVYDLLGLRTREVALGYEPVVLDSGVTSNVETAFRGLIQDFSFLGAMLLCFAAGMLVGVAYNNSCRGDLCGTVFLSGYYAFLLWSPIVSIFNYNAAILALVVGWLLVRRGKTGTATGKGARPVILPTNQCA